MKRYSRKERRRLAALDFAVSISGGGYVDSNTLIRRASRIENYIELGTLPVDGGE